MERASKQKIPTAIYNYSCKLLWDNKFNPNQINISTRPSCSEEVPSLNEHRISRIKSPAKLKAKHFYPLQSC